MALTETETARLEKLVRGRMLDREGRSIADEDLDAVNAEIRERWEAELEERARSVGADAWDAAPE